MYCRALRYFQIYLPAKQSNHLKGAFRFCHTEGMTPPSRRRCIVCITNDKHFFSIAIQSFPKHQKNPRRKFKTEHQRLINTLLRKIILKQNFPSIAARQIIFKENRRPYEEKEVPKAQK